MDYGGIRMHIAFQFLLLIIGFAALVFGADKFVDGAAALAKKMGIPELIVGFTIVAMGTSAPEAAVSISAAAKGTADMAVGNVAGSNVMNILLILGVTALICKIPVKKNTVRIEIPFLILVSVAFLVMGIIGQGYSKIDGAIMLVVFVGYIVYLIFQAKKNKEEFVPEEEHSGKKPMKLWQMIMWIVLGIAMIVVGSNVAVEAATYIAVFFGMSQRLIGLTIIALGTSLPELVTSIMAARKGKADLAIGDVVGSNIFNILFVLGTTAVVVPMKNSPVLFSNEFIFDCVAGIVAAILLLVCVLPKKKLGRVGGIIMLVGYAGYFAWLMIH